MTFVKNSGIIIFLIIPAFILKSDYLYKSFNQSVADTVGLHQKSMSTGFASYFSPLIQKQYEKGVKIIFNKKKDNKIPKILHFIWIGGEFPAYLNFCLKSWKFHHSDWEIKIWQDSNINEIIDQSNINYNEIPNIGAKVDLLRLEILYKYGGIYVDSDFFCLKPIDDLIKLDFFISSECNYYYLVNNGIIGSTKGHIILDKMICDIKLNLSFQKKEGYFDVLTATGPFWVTKFFNNIIEIGLDKNCIVIPPSYFCSFPIYEKEAFWRCDLSLYELLNKYTFSESIAVHLWHSSWNPSCPMGSGYKDKQYSNEIEFYLKLGLGDLLKYKHLDIAKPYLLTF